MKKTRIAIAISTSLLATSALATNGMNMEGYGPVSTAMGGTAQAYNNGLGGMMNNPATMGHGSVQGNKFQVALGALNPTVKSSYDAANLETKSTGGPYIMPGIGYAQKKNGFVWGIGILGQGGMGTEYGKAGSGDLFSGGMSSGGLVSTCGMSGCTNTPTAGSATPLSGMDIRSEVSVGRVVVPFGYEVTNKLNLAASIDFVWAGMDLRMDMDGGTFGQIMQGNGGSASGSMATVLQSYMAPNATYGNAVFISDVNYARFDFSDNSDYTGEAKGTGFGGKLGFTYDISPKFTIGGSYHSKTQISDMEGDATMTMNVDMLNQADYQYYATNVPVEGEVKIEDFQWPETFAIGMAYRPTNAWMFTADFKRIGWSGTMKELKMNFVANSTQSNAVAQQLVSAGAEEIDLTLDQDWDDQNVFMLGAQWKVKKNIALRAGANIANNPVPDETMNPLFPAIIENHYTAGIGYGIGKHHVVDASLAYAPEVEQTSDAGITSSHSQLNWQVMYTYKWNIERKAGF